MLDKEKYKRNRSKYLKRSKNQYKVRKRKAKIDPRITLLENAKTSARLRQIEFNLTIEDIVVPNICPILLIPMKFNKKVLGDDSYSVDRIDNTKGYIPGNIGVISYKANRHKANMSKEDIDRLHKYVFNT